MHDEVEAVDVALPREDEIMLDNFLRGGFLRGGRLDRLRLFCQGRFTQQSDAQNAKPGAPPNAPERLRGPHAHAR